MGNNVPHFGIIEPSPIVGNGILPDSIDDMIKVQNWNDFYHKKTEVTNVLVLMAGGVISKHEKKGKNKHKIVNVAFQKTEFEDLLQLYNKNTDNDIFASIIIAQRIYDLYFKKSIKDRVRGIIARLIPDLIAPRIHKSRQLFLSRCIPQGAISLIEIIKCLDFLRTINYIDFLHTKDPYPTENDIEQAIEKLLENHYQYVNIISLCPDFFEDRRILNSYISQENFDYLKGRIFYIGPRVKSRGAFQNDTDIVIQIASDIMLHYEPIMQHPSNFYRIEKGMLGDNHKYSQLFENHDFGINYNKDLMQMLHRPDILCTIERLLRIKFSDFTFSVQPPFLQFLAYATLDNFDRVRLLLSRANTIKEKEERLRVFLATAEQKPIIKEGEEVKKSMGELILELEENLSQTTEGKEIAQKIFKQYSDIMFLAEKNANDIKNTLIKSENNNIGFSEQTYSRELLQRANKQLREYFTILNKNKGIDNINNSLSELEQIYTKCRVDMIQFGTLFSVTEDKEKYDLEELMKELNIEGGEKKSGTEMSESEYDIIRQFYDENYSKDSRIDKINTIVEEMIASDKIEEDGKKVYYSIFYYQGEPILTIRFKEQGNQVDVGAFNSPIHFQGFSFGSLVFKKMLESYGGKNIHGTVITGNENLLKFYEKFGFKVELDESGKWKKIEKDGIWFYPIKK